MEVTSIYFDENPTVLILNIYNMTSIQSKALIQILGARVLTEARLQ